MKVDLPSLAVGLIVGAYWSRVVYMAWRVRRRARQSAHFIPPEKIGRITRIVWIPLVFAWTVIPIATAFARSKNPFFHLIYRQPIVQWTAALVAAVAFVATLKCWKAMGRAWRMGIDPNEKNPLIDTGPFARVRHPIYALSMLLMVSSLAACPVLLLALVAAVHLFLLNFEASREEAHMYSVHGEIYTQYCARTGRFIPK
jgi:protein-S-isoprenylcysteine O-methyltransferase Ste14